MFVRWGCVLFLCSIYRCFNQIALLSNSGWVLRFLRCRALWPSEISNLNAMDVAVVPEFEWLAGGTPHVTRMFGWGTVEHVGFVTCRINRRSCQTLTSSLRDLNDRVGSFFFPKTRVTKVKFIALNS